MQCTTPKCKQKYYALFCPRKPIQTKVGFRLPKYLQINLPDLFRFRSKQQCNKIVYLFVGKLHWPKYLQHNMLQARHNVVRLSRQEEHAPTDVLICLLIQLTSRPPDWVMLHCSIARKNVPAHCARRRPKGQTQIPAAKSIANGSQLTREGGGVGPWPVCLLRARSANNFYFLKNVVPSRHIAWLYGIGAT